VVRGVTAPMLDCFLTVVLVTMDTREVELKPCARLTGTTIALASHHARTAAHVRTWGSCHTLVAVRLVMKA